MRTNSKFYSSLPGPRQALAARLVHRFAPASNDDEGDADEARAGSPSARHDEFPYKVELWDPSKGAVEQVLAVTRNGSIGYAAYFEATRQYPNRYVTLRHNGRIVSRFNGPTH